mmetsp:Transcript_10412/g.27656  ORF Transcript_10412/g.27656 Transcript_10412/m.27656 type:complete len:209 (-) Transcript_10412:191-817(-)
MPLAVRPLPARALAAHAVASAPSLAFSSLLLGDHVIVELLAVLRRGLLLLVIDRHLHGEVGDALDGGIVELSHVRVVERPLGGDAVLWREREQLLQQVDGLRRRIGQLGAPRRGAISRAVTLGEVECIHRIRLQRLSSLLAVQALHHRGRKGRDPLDDVLGRHARELHNLLDLVDRGRAREDGLPLQHLGEDAAHRPHVDRKAVLGRP